VEGDCVLETTVVGCQFDSDARMVGRAHMSWKRMLARSRALEASERSMAASMVPRRQDAERGSVCVCVNGVGSHDSRRWWYNEHVPDHRRCSSAHDAGALPMAELHPHAARTRPPTTTRASCTYLSFSQHHHAPHRLLAPPIEHASSTETGMRRQMMT
jgi:hypothetical protein